MDKIWAGIIGALIALLLNFMNQWFLVKKDRIKIKKEIVTNLYWMINQVYRDYPNSHYRMWDQYGHLARHLSAEELARVEAMPLGADSNLQKSSRDSNREFNQVHALLKLRVSEIESKWLKIK